jgi:hypothetical protein
VTQLVESTWGSCLRPGWVPAPISTTNISTTGFNGIANCLVNRQRPTACKGRVVKSDGVGKETSKAVPLGDTPALEAAWTASDEYTAHNKAGKERQAKHAKAKKAALAP